MDPLITIYKYNTDVVRAVIDPDDKSAIDMGIMRGDTLTITFSYPTYIDFQPGDYCTVYGDLYRMNRLNNWSKVAARNYTYTLVMEGRYHQTSRAQFLTLNAYNKFTEGKFKLTGRPVDFVDLAVTNMNRAFPGEAWTRGTVLDGDFLTLEFDGENCLQVLSKLADRYATEFTIKGTALNLIRQQPSSGVVLEYGKGKALYGATRSNQDENTGPTTRLFAYGSDKNLGSNYRGGAPRLRMADSLYIEKNVNRYGVFEKTVVFDDIYPSRTGTVTAITDNNTFTDAGIDFNVNTNLLPGVSAKITFKTGLLAGYAFELSSFDNGTKTFEFNNNTESQTITLPNDELKPAIGDKYVLTDITMPLSYYTDAEARLKAKAQQTLTGLQPKYDVLCNPKYFKEQALDLKMGYSYTLKSTDAGVNLPIRLVGYNRSVRNKFLYNELTLADTVIPQPPIIKLLNSI